MGTTRSEYRTMLTDTGVVEVREVFLDAEGAIVGWTSYPASLWGVDEAELRDAVPRLLAALDRPVLVERELADRQRDERTGTAAP